MEQKMKIKVTIEELEPKHISLVSSLITELHRAGIEVDVPEEQEDTQETQEDHAEKIREATVATKEDVENWTSYARKHLQGSELLEATQSILAKRKQAQQLEEQNIEERNKKQRHYFALLREWGMDERVHDLMKLQLGSSNDWSREQLENIIEQIEEGPQNQPILQVSSEFALMAINPAHIETDTKSLVEKVLVEGTFEASPWFCQYLAAYMDLVTIGHEKRKWAKKHRYEDIVVTEAWELSVPAHYRTLTQWEMFESDLATMELDHEAVERFFHKAMSLLKSNEPEDKVEAWKQKAIFFASRKFGPRTACACVHKWRHAVEDTRQKKSQPRGDETGPFLAVF
jgi:hypothetical protein